MDHQPKVSNPEALEAAVRAISAGPFSIGFGVHKVSPADIDRRAAPWSSYAPYARSHHSQAPATRPDSSNG